MNTDEHGKDSLKICVHPCASVVLWFSPCLPASVVLLILLSGCTVGPDYKPPQPSLPEAFLGAQIATTRPTTQPISTTQPASTIRWWTTFNDPMLDMLVERAVAANLDLRIATARVLEARALRGVIAAERFPSINSSASYSRVRISENTGISALAGAFSGGAGGAGGTGAIGGIGGILREQDLFQLGFDANWELDLFGGIRRAVESADAGTQAAQANRNDVLVSLLAEVARNYLELRGLQRQLAIAQENLATQRQSVELTSARFQAGLTSELDVKRAEAQVATTESQLPSLQASIRHGIHRLSSLIAQQPVALLEELRTPMPLPAMPPQVPVGLPSDLLRRRSDIRRAERELAAATANIGAATADLFPRFSLTGTAGLQSTKAENLFDWSSRFFNAGPGVSFPIFNAGRIRSNIRVQNARQEQALAVYEKTVLTALEDVENALVSYSEEQVRRESLARAVAANRRAVELANERYTKGLVDFLSVLDAQRSLYIVEDQLVQSDRAVAMDLVALYKALGGGWEATQVSGNPARN